ncbi:MAG: phage terminase small subunit P27 family [Succinivibrionaceae bacterium]|nr:phage terminase small subunit P27 family [Succinivibrionaceae bacterium]
MNKKSTAVKELQGTLRPCRVNKLEPKPQTDITEIKPPSNLAKGAKQIWEFAVSQMPKGMLTTLDAPLLAQWATTLDFYNRVNAQIEQSDFTIYDANGNMEITKLMNTSLKLVQTLRQLEQELGFTPVSRSRVQTVGKKEENKNGFLDL